MRSSRVILLLLMFGALAGVALVGEALVAQETLYMSVLSSRRHAWGRNDNPVIGLFVSTDAGKTWQHNGWREYIRMFYTEAGPDGTLWSACGNGVLRSTDRGGSWRITTGWEVTEVLKLEVDPRNPSRVAAATAYGPIITTDLGGRWTFLREGLPRAFCSDICIDRTDGALLAATERGVFRRAAADSLWHPTSLRDKDIRVLARHPLQPDVVLAGTEEDGVWRSTDRGMTWSPTSAGLNHPTVYAIAFAPGSRGAVYLGTHGGGVYRSDDGGTTWKQKSAGLSPLDIHSIVVPPSRPSTVFAGTLNGGLFESRDRGETWLFNSQPDAQVWGLTVGTGAGAGY
ncbi:MAG: hypothetical protein H6Q31_3288 [Bacteroidetes bacterium]|jgi:photosystem II stability/assembly factor-like uncharacterized protein|nr:hypothetical protein [Bacteroidota bacterium]